jgi:hypothetical protein
MGYSGARGKLIHEKNLESKNSCQTPFDYYVTAQRNLRTITCWNVTEKW